MSLLSCVLSLFRKVSLKADEYLLMSFPHSFRTQTFAYPESTTEREEILQGLQGRIEDIKSVSVTHVRWSILGQISCSFTNSHFPTLQVLSQTEDFLQQLLGEVVSVLPQWKVRVQKCKAVHMVLNLCSPSVTDKCLIAEAWCPTAKLPELQNALREGGVRQLRAAETLRATGLSNDSNEVTLALKRLATLFLLFNQTLFSPSSEEKWQWGGFFLQPSAFHHIPTHPVSYQLLYSWFPKHCRCLRSGQLP